MNEPPFWSLPAEALYARLDSGATGLRQAAAEARLAKVGPNAIGDRADVAAYRLLLRQFQSPLVLILVLGACASLALREWVDASIILVIVAGSTMLGFYQEYRASKAVAELKQRLALTARVLRNGKEALLPTRLIVPGDVVALSAGNLVPADGLIIEANDFLVAEASLTGESFPVEKRPGVIAAATPIGGRTNAAFMGSSVRSGTARLLVVETGARTAFGAIAAELDTEDAETEFERGVRQFGETLVRVMIFTVLFVLVVNQFLGRPLTESLLFAVALAVGLSPELLPAIISVTLSSGARHLAKNGVIVRKLDAIENLGSMDVLCTDKTGTLTQGTIVLQDAVGPDGVSSPDVHFLAYLNAALETGIENPLDAAIVSMGERRGLSIAAARKVDEIPYDFLRRRLTIVVQDDADPSTHRMITKGAFDNVIAVCNAVRRDGTAKPLDEQTRRELAEFFEAEGKRGYRVLGIAERRIAVKADYTRDDEADFSFAGFLLFLDPPKATAASTIRDLAALGIDIKVISGDNRFVTAHLASAVGLDPRTMVTGEELSAMHDEALRQRVRATNLFVEIDPQQKERIVRALQRAGYAVGYMGDGINDAPALQTADVGISVDTAVDVARESADVVLLRPDLNVLRQGVEDGRRIFANTLKYISITTSANFGNMMSMALATPLLPFLPLLPKQILLNNFMSDLPSITISTDNIDRDQITSPQRWHIGEVQRFMLVFGLVSSCFDLLTFAVLLFVFEANAPLFQTVWFVVSLLTELAVVLVLRTKGPAFASRPSQVLAATTGAVGLLCLLLPYVPPIARLFGFVPMPAGLAFSALIIVFAYIAATELAKRLFYAAVKP